MEKEREGEKKGEAGLPRFVRVMKVESYFLQCFPALHVFRLPGACAVLGGWPQVWQNEH